MTAQLSGDISQARQVVDALDSHLFRGQDLAACGYGIDTPGFRVFLLSSVHKSGVAYILMIRQHLSNSLQIEGCFADELFCQGQVFPVHRPNGGRAEANNLAGETIGLFPGFVFAVKAVQHAFR